MTPIIRRATAADVTSWYGKPVERSMRAIVAEIDGRAIGLAGYAFDGERMIAFSEMKDELRQHKKTILRAAREYMRMLREYKVPVVAIANQNEKSAVFFLLHIGFKHLQTYQGREIFVCQA